MAANPEFNGRSSNDTLFFLGVVEEIGGELALGDVSHLVQSGLRPWYGDDLEGDRLC